MGTNMDTNDCWHCDKPSTRLQCHHRPNPSRCFKLLVVKSLSLEYSWKRHLD